MASTANPTWPLSVPGTLECGAIICFLAACRIVLVGVDMIVRGIDRIAWKLTSWLAMIEYLIAGSFFAR